MLVEKRVEVLGMSFRGESGVVGDGRNGRGMSCCFQNFHRLS